MTFISFGISTDSRVRTTLTPPTLYTVCSYEHYTDVASVILSDCLRTNSTTAFKIGHTFVISYYMWQDEIHIIHECCPSPVHVVLGKSSNPSITCNPQTLQQKSGNMSTTIPVEYYTKLPENQMKHVFSLFSKMSLLWRICISLGSYDWLINWLIDWLGRV